MWRPDEAASSSDESVEEEISTGNSGNFESAAGACKLKSVFDDIFADIQASIPTLELENSSEESDEDEEPVLYTREAWPLSPKILSKTSLPSSKVDNSPANSASDSGLFLVSPDGHTTSSSSLSDCDQDSIEFLSSSPSMLPSTLQTKSVTTSSTQTTNTDDKPTETQIPLSTTSDTELSYPSNDQEKVQLSFDLLEHLDLGNYLERTNEVTVLPVFPPILSDSGSDDADDSTCLMEELVRLSRKQQSDAAPEPVSPADHHVRGASESTKSKKHDVGVMSGPSVSSKGVTACLDHPVSKRSNNTVFLDLRKIEEQTSLQRHQELPSSICRILGISNDRDPDLSSSSDEEDDLQSWQEQRRKAKEASLSCARQNTHSQPKKPPAKHQKAVEEMKLDLKEIHRKVDEKVVQEPVSSKSDTHKDIKIGKTLVEHGTSVSLDNVQLNLKNEHKVVREKTEDTVKQAWTASSISHKDKTTKDRTLPQDEGKAMTETSVKQEICHSTAKEQNLHEPLPKKSDSKVINNKMSPAKMDVLTNVDSEIKKDLVSTVNHGLKKTVDSDIKKDLVSAVNDKHKKTVVKHKTVLTEEEKAKRQRLLKSLQNLKPQLSSNKHHPVAPCTPVLFHEEASYESHVLSLPNLDTNTSYLLMSTKLSSCGELSVIRQGARGGTTPETHCFSSLIAWLACLVKPSVNTTDYAEVCGAPFYVVGLQQSWHEGQLKIEIGICGRTTNRQTEKGDLMNGNDVKGKAKNKANNSFRHAVSKFLSTNTLNSVYARLLECNPCPLQHLAEMSMSKRNLSTLLNVNPDPEAMQRVFGAKPGFFWPTMEMEDAPNEEKTGVRLCQGAEIHNTVMLMQDAVFHQPFCLLDVLTRARNKALDVAGLRLVYQQSEVCEEKPAYGSQVHKATELEETSVGSQTPLLILALRGPQAISQWQEEVGPVDAKLAQRTDPNSLRALYSHGTKEDHLFWCPRNAHSAGTELARWFGGRVPENGVINIGSSEPIVSLDEKPPKGSPSKGKNSKTHLLTSSLHATYRPPPFFLTASTDTSVFLLISPALPVRFLGQVLSVCFERGFCTQAIKRSHLSTNRLSGLGLAPEQLSVFCPRRVNQSEGTSYTHSPVASTLLLLKRENAIHHTLPVVKSLVDALAQTGLSQSSFLSIPYSDSMLKQLGGDFSVTPDPAAYPVDLLRHAFHSNPELEQVCVLTLLKEKATISAGSILNQLLSHKESQESENDICGFELLGLKLLPSLSLHQAKEFTPCKIGDGQWKKSLHTLTAGPALVLAFRGVNAFARLRRFVDSHLDSSKSKLSRDNLTFDMLMSCTPELACRQLSVIFFDRELFSDQSSRRNLHLLPPPRRVINGVCSGSSESLNEADAPGSPNRKARNRRVGLSKSPLKPSLGSVETLWHADMSVLQSLLEKPRVIPTVCVLKPRTANKHLGKVLKRLGHEGFNVIAMKMMCLTSADVSTLMGKQDKELERHVSHMTSDPVVALCLHRENAVGRLLEVLGPSDPRAAKKQSQFFLRGSFGEDCVQNGFYGSETYEEAIRDIKLLFPEGVCCPPSIDLKAEEIACLALDEIFSVTPNRTLVELTTEEQSRVESSPGMTLLPSSLLEVNCLLLLPQLLTCRAQPGRRTNISYAEIIEALLTSGFHFIGFRMVLLGVSEAADCAKLYSGCLPADWKPHHLAGQLSKSPFLAMAVLRDGAVTCYDTLCDSSPKLKALSANSGRYMLAGKTLKEAKRMVECFFDGLIPNRKARIATSPP